MENRPTDQQNNGSTEQQNNETTEPQTNRTTDVGRAMTINFPTNIYQGIHNRAGKLGMRKKDLIIKWIRGGAREEMYLIQILLELKMSLAELVSYCRKEQTI